MHNTSGTRTAPRQQASALNIRSFIKAQRYHGSGPGTRAADAAIAQPANFIGTVDVWQLRRLHWPIMRALTPGYVDHLELSRYLKELLATGRWRNVHAVPHEDTHHPYPHLFDVYGQPI